MRLYVAPSLRQRDFFLPPYLVGRGTATVIIEELLPQGSTTETMGRPAGSRNLLLSTNARYAYEVGAVDTTRHLASGSSAGGNFAIVLAMMVGLLDIACVVIATSSTLLIKGNALAQIAIQRNGPEIIATYRYTTLSVGLLLVLMGLRSAAKSTRIQSKASASSAYFKAALSGLNAAGIALLAWWTAWIFVA